MHHHRCTMNLYNRRHMCLHYSPMILNISDLQRCSNAYPFEREESVIAELTDSRGFEKLKTDYTSHNSETTPHSLF